ncbi:MAG: tRNA glutamyl-Q(34) synthetase GluQRS [Tepidisphaeraceae bacterium]|jgi:glutamyl-tRNA synthetase
MPTTRLAPSPTGALHLGNARTFLINWLLARQNGWRIILRIEDLDGPRVKRGADQLLLQDLQYLGLDWDAGPIYQSTRQALYTAAVDRILKQRLAYPCVCSRREVELAASAPHPEDHTSIYPGTCRGKFASLEQARAQSGKKPAVRFAAPDRQVEFEDAFLGSQRFNVGADLGDFVIAKSDGTAAYQLAVVVDDLEGEVDQVVRGDDLLDCAPRQILLYEALGAASRVPHYTHVPLVVGPDGRRLAKRHGDTRLAAYRQYGVPPDRVLALLARWCGIDDAPRLEHPRELLDRFRLDRIGKSAIVFTAGDDRFLREAA